MPGRPQGPPARSATRTTWRTSSPARAPRPDTVWRRSRPWSDTCSRRWKPCRLIANCLEYLADNQVCDAKPLPIELRIEPISLGIADVAEVINPDRGVDDHHDQLLRDSATTRSLEITVPGHLATEPTDAALASRLDQQPQTFLDRGALGSRATAPHHLPHQAVIDIDVRPHTARCVRFAELCVSGQWFGRVAVRLSCHFVHREYLAAPGSRIDGVAAHRGAMRNNRRFDNHRLHVRRQSEMDG
jgi:hypothetical protein